MAKSLLLASIILLLGVGIAFQAGMLEKPSFGVEDRGDWGEITDERTEIITEVWIDNQNPVGLDMDQVRVSYQLIMNDVRLAEGEKDGIALEEGNQTKELRTYLMNQKISTWWARHLNNNEVSELEVPVNLYLEEPVPVNIEGISYQDSIDTNIEGTMDQSVQEIEGTYYGPSIPLVERPEIQVKNGSAKFGDVNENETNMMFRLDVHNPNPYPVPAPGLTGNLEMNEIRLAEWDRNSSELAGADDQVIQPGETQKIRFRARMDNQKIDDWLVSHIRQNESTNAELEAKLKFELEGVKFTVPTGEGMKCQFDFQTGILVDDQKSDSEFNGCSLPERDITGQNTGSDQDRDDLNSSDRADDSSNSLTDNSGLLS